MFFLEAAPDYLLACGERISWDQGGCMVQMQAVQAKLTGVQEASGANASQSPNPRILVLRESGDVEVNVDLGDHENTPDGSFVRTVTHRHISMSGDEHEDDRGHMAQSKGELCSAL